MLPILAWVPLVVSAVLLGASWLAYWTVGAGSPRALGLLTVWFAVAGYIQLQATTLALTTTGLVLQAVLAIVLMLRAKRLLPAD